MSLSSEYYLKGSHVDNITSSCQGTLAMVMSDALDSPQYVTPFTSMKSGFPRDTNSAYC